MNAEPWWPPKWGATGAYADLSRHHPKAFGVWRGRGGFTVMLKVESTPVSDRIARFTVTGDDLDLRCFLLTLARESEITSEGKNP